MGKIIQQARLQNSGDLSVARSAKMMMDLL